MERTARDEATLGDVALSDDKLPSIGYDLIGVRAEVAVYGVNLDTLIDIARDGSVYVPTDDKGSKIGNPIHASKIGRGVGYSVIQRKMQQSKQSIKPFIAGMRQRVLGVMQTSPRNEEELLTRLEEQGYAALSARATANASAKCFSNVSR